MLDNSSRHAAALLSAVGWLFASCQPASTPEPQGYSAPTAESVPVTVVQQVELAPPSATPPCSYGAEFLEDLTIPDGSIVEPGQTLDKRWAVQNTGSCDWGIGYRLVRVDSGAIEGPAELALFPARAGENAIWQQLLIAPGSPGEYLASWQARSPEGFLFGDQVFILIKVAESSETES